MVDSQEVNKPASGLLLFPFYQITKVKLAHENIAIDPGRARCPPQKPKLGGRRRQLFSETFCFVVAATAAP